MPNIINPAHDAFYFCVKKFYHRIVNKLKKYAWRIKSNANRPFPGSQAVGRIGYTDGERAYIVPVTYVYDGKDIIGQAKEGMKVNMMRSNPNVCFEVDSMTNMAN
jgi:hypothetical protein